ncbi:MAG: hypothetical protein H0Z39_02205 [Peptococcaceae bacterium]|nr:hypothetical protein [Peptococcaceae bacterium]
MSRFTALVSDHSYKTVFIPDTGRFITGVPKGSPVYYHPVNSKSM